MWCSADYTSTLIPKGNRLHCVIMVPLAHHVNHRACGYTSIISIWLVPVLIISSFSWVSLHGRRACFCVWCSQTYATESSAVCHAYYVLSVSLSSSLLRKGESLRSFHECNRCYPDHQPHHDIIQQPMNAPKEVQIFWHRNSMQLPPSPTVEWLFILWWDSRKSCLGSIRLCFRCH